MGSETCLGPAAGLPAAGRGELTSRVALQDRHISISLSLESDLLARQTHMLSSFEDPTVLQFEHPRFNAYKKWLLVLPCLFFVARGNFSFLMNQSANGSAGGSLVDPSTTRNLGVLGYGAFPLIAYGIVCTLILFKIESVISMARQRAMLTAVAGVTILSAAWSQNPFRSFYNGMFYLIGTAFVYYLVSSLTAEEIMELVIRLGVVVCLLSAITVLLFPKHGVDVSAPRTAGAWMGIFQDRVTSAKCSVYLLSPALIFGPWRRRWLMLVYIAAMLIFIVEAKAVSSLFVTAVFVSFMIVLHVGRRLERRTALFLGAIFTFVLLIVSMFVSSHFASILEAFGRDPTLTGRTEIWSYLFTSIAKRPLLGYGYYAFWQGMTGESANVIMAAHWFFGYAHNGLLEIVLQIGVLGAGLFLLTFVKACRDAWFCFKFGRSYGVEWYSGLLLLAVIYNIDEETLLWPNDFLSMLYIVACCGLAVEAQRIRKTLSTQIEIEQDISFERSMELTLA